MIDGNNTSYDWQVYPKDVCVILVGSVEQHSIHLPIASDCIEGEFFSRMIAEELDAALLPPLYYGNCLEHSGFRGSVSLRPETLMQVVRDIADEVERQNFRIMILANGHGGNFSLGPVTRDINRMNRPLKILLVNWWDFCDSDVTIEKVSRGQEIHAGAWETAVVLAIRPDLVRPDRRDIQRDPNEKDPLKQRDLNTFGTGHFNPHGAIGLPSLADADVGKRVIASVRKNMIPSIRDRIERLRANPRYSGAGGIALRRLVEGDTPAGMRLKTAAGWNQTEADWRRMLMLRPEGCAAAVHNGAVVGSATTIRYPDGLAWIGMVLVDPAFRRMGIGRMLMEDAMASARDCRSIGLDATDEGRPLYEKLGFKAASTIHRMVTRDLLPPAARVADVRPMDEAHLAEACALDRAAFGFDRSAILRDLLKGAPRLAFAAYRDGRLCAHCFGRKGSNFTQVGPIVAVDAAAAMDVAGAALRVLVGQPVVIDVPEAQTEFLAWVGEMGFTGQRSLCRMYFGGQPAASDVRRQFGSAGPEFG